MHAGNISAQRLCSSKHVCTKLSVCFRRQHTSLHQHHAQCRRSRGSAVARAGMQPIVCVTSVSDDSFEQEVMKLYEVRDDFNWGSIKGFTRHAIRISAIMQEIVEEKGKYVLVDFWATWCGPCKLMDPFLKQIEEEYGGKLKVVKVEADPNPRLVEKYKVYGLPTLILFKDGSMLRGSMKEGAITKPMLLKYLEANGVSK